MKKTPYHQIGITTEGKPVMGGLFKAADTFGIPLEVSIMLCVDRGWCPGLYDYLQSAVGAGWLLDRAVKRLVAACEQEDFELPERLKQCSKCSKSS